MTRNATISYAYDSGYAPPLPVIPVNLRARPTHPPVQLAMLVDTGADHTILPRTVIDRLRPDPTGTVTLSGVGPANFTAARYLVELELGDRLLPLQVVCFGDEAILGRDVLNQLVVTLDGPARLLTVR